MKNEEEKSIDKLLQKHIDPLEDISVSPKFTDQVMHRVDKFKQVQTINAGKQNFSRVFTLGLFLSTVVWIAGFILFYQFGGWDYIYGYVNRLIINADQLTWIKYIVVGIVLHFFLTRIMVGTIFAMKHDVVRNVTN